MTSGYTNLKQKSQLIRLGLIYSQVFNWYLPRNKYQAGGYVDEAA